MNVNGDLGKDISAGLAVAILAIPASIGAGIIAFAPLGSDYARIGSLAGLYSGLVLAVVPLLFGVSRLQYNAPGPVSSGIVATFFAAALVDPNLQQVLGEDRQVFADTLITVAFLCCLLSGALQVVFGVLGLGRLVKLIPHPIVAGLVNGIAVLIVLGQIPAFLGLAGDAFADAGLAALARTRPWELAVGLATLAAMILTRKYFSKLPHAAVGVLAGTLLYHLLRALFHPVQGPVIGNLPFGLPAPVQVPKLAGIVLDPSFLTVLPKLAGTAVTLAVIGSISTLLTATIAESLSMERQRERRELIGVGVANMVAPLFAAVPGGGSPLRVLGNHESGGRTYVSQITCSLTILAVTAGLGPLLGRIPLSVVAAVLLYMSTGFIDGWTRQMVPKLPAIKDRALRREVALNLLLSAVVTLVMIWRGLLPAVAVGLVEALCLFLYNADRTVVRRHLHGLRSKTVRSARRLELLATHGGASGVIELQGALFFGTAERVAKEVETRAKQWRTIILDFRKVSETDTSGVLVLQRIDRQLERRSVRLLISNVAEGSTMRVFMEENGLADMARQGRFFVDTDAALTAAEDELLARVDPVARGGAEMALDEMAIFSGFTPAELAEVERRLVRRTWSKGEAVVRQGDEDDGFYLLTAGRATVTRRSPGSGRPTRLVSLDTGTVFGEAALFTAEQRRTASVVATTDLVCWQVSSHALDDLREGHLPVFTKLVTNIGANLLARLIAANDTLQELSE